MLEDRLHELYGQLDQFLANAEAGMEFHRSVAAAQQVLTQLMTSLDVDGENKMVASLYKIYDFMDYRLAQADAAGDQEGAKEVRVLLKDLRRALPE